MKKLTDENVAKALGWYQMQTTGFITTVWKTPNVAARKRHPDASIHNRLPAFTTSLDAIVAEIEARGLVWTIYMMNGSKDYRAEVDTILGHPNNQYFANTAPLALCAALLSYLAAKPKDTLPMDGKL